MKKAILIFVVFGYLTGCTTGLSRVDREIGAHQPLAYKQGYGAGCDSGYVAAGHPYYRFNKNINRFLNDGLYQQGWNDGFSVCKGKYEAIGRAGQ